MPVSELDHPAVVPQEMSRLLHERETRPGAGIMCDVGSARNQKAPNR